jgi:hypothetical protein
MNRPCPPSYCSLQGHESPEWFLLKQCRIYLREQPWCDFDDTAVKPHNLSKPKEQEQWIV